MTVGETIIPKVGRKAERAGLGAGRVIGEVIGACCVGVKIR